MNFIFFICTIFLSLLSLLIRKYLKLYYKLNKMGCSIGKEEKKVIFEDQRTHEKN